MSHFSNVFHQPFSKVYSSKTAGQIEAKFHALGNESLFAGSGSHDHMLIYGINPFKSFMEPTGRLTGSL